MLGLFMLGFFGIVALLAAALRESQDVIDNSPPAPPTKDAYEV